MDHLLSKTVKNIKTSAIREIGNKVANDPSIINFTIGQPDFVTPVSILEAGKRAIEARKKISLPLNRFVISSNS